MFEFNDGGRAKAGYKGSAGDCGARAMAIALAMDYQKAYDHIAHANFKHHGIKSARNGVDRHIYANVLLVFNWLWQPAPKFEGRKAYCSDMPSGIVIARQAGHYVAIIDGIPHDIWDCSHKMIYGYWIRKS